MQINSDHPLEELKEWKTVNVCVCMSHGCLCVGENVGDVKRCFEEEEKRPFHPSPQVVVWQKTEAWELWKSFLFYWWDTLAVGNGCPLHTTSSLIALLHTQHTALPCLLCEKLIMLPIHKARRLEPPFSPRPSDRVLAPWCCFQRQVLKQLLCGPMLVLMLMVLWWRQDDSLICSPGVQG